MAKTRKKALESTDPLVPAATLIDENPLGAASRKDHQRVTTDTDLKTVPYDQRAEVRALQGLEEIKREKLDKHSENLRYNIAYSAKRLSEDLAIAVSSKAKKDVNHLKGLVWSLGVLYDKLAASTSEAVSIRIPTKLLDNVKVILAVQAEKKAKQPIVLDTQSNPAPDNSTA
jgi:hypothetical protein